MERLPNEIVSLVFAILPLSGAKSLRQTCKLLSDLGEDVVFSNFEFRLYPQVERIRAFSHMAQCSRISKRLKCVSYESGVLPEWQNYRLWESHEKSRCEAEFSEKHASKYILRDLYHTLRLDLDARFTSELPRQYEMYRWWLEEQARLMGETKRAIELVSILRRVPWIEEVKLIMKEPIIRLEDLEKNPERYRCQVPDGIEPRERIRNRRNNTIKHFCTLVRALRILQNDGPQMAIRRIKTHLPREILSSETLLPDLDSADRVQGARIHADFHAVIASLVAMDLDFVTFPHSDWLERGGDAIYTRGRDLGSLRLMTLLNLSRDLRKLSLNFAEARKAEFSYALFDTTNLDRFPRTWVPRLKDLTLRNFTCNWGDFSALVSEMAAVKSLTLIDGQVETGSLIWVFRLLQNRLDLDHFSIEGSWTALEDDGAWHSRGSSNSAGCLDYPGPFPAVKGLRYRIEQFVVDGGDCPLPVWGRDENARSTWDSESDGSFHYHAIKNAHQANISTYNEYFGAVPQDLP